MVLNLVGSDGQPVTVSITAHPAPDRVTVSQLPEGGAAYSVWGLKLPTLRQRLFRCVAIRENDDGTYAITAVQHVPEKESIVDNGAKFDPLPGTSITNTPPAVQHLTTEILAEDGQYQARARWDTPRVVKGVNFSLRLTVKAEDNSDRLTSSLTLSETEHTFRNLTPGRYTLTVRAVNSQGQQGDPASTDFSIAAPAVPSYVELPNTGEKRYANGTLTVVIDDDQSFDRQVSIPAIAFQGAAYESQTSNDVWDACTLIVRKNGVEIYNQTSIGVPAVFSQTLDMPAGSGRMTLSFSVSTRGNDSGWPHSRISDLLVIVTKKSSAGITIS